MVGWLSFSTLEKWLSVGDVLCIPAVHSSLITQAVGVSPRQAVWVLLLWCTDYVGSLVGSVGSRSSWLPGLPCVEAASRWLAGPGYKAADCRTLGGPRACAGSLVGRVRVQKTLGLFPAHWWVKPGPGVWLQDRGGPRAGIAGGWEG